MYNSACTIYYENVHTLLMMFTSAPDEIKSDTIEL